MENQQQARVRQTGVALYARTYQTENESNGRSIEHQIDSMKAYCEQEGKKIVDIYIDEGVIGTDRGQLHSLNRLLNEAKEGKFDKVMVYNLSLISRKTIDLLEVSSLLGKHKIGIYTLLERLDTASPMGCFALQMMAAMLEFETMAPEAASLLNKWSDGSHA